MTDPFSCNRKNYHSGIEETWVDTQGGEVVVKARCFDCEKEISAYIDFSGVGCHFEAEEIES